MFKEVRLANVGTVGVEKFGHSEGARMKIFGRYILAVERPADEKAKLRYPNIADLENYNNYSNELLAENKEDYATQHDLSVDQLDQILMEGFEKEWPNYL